MPSALIAVVLAAVFNFVLISIGSSWAVQSNNLIQLPNILQAPEEVLVFPDFSYLAEPLIYTGAITLAIVASLETLLNLEAISLILKSVHLHLIVSYGRKEQVILCRV